MKSGIYAGAIAGVVCGIVGVVCSMASGQLGVIKPPVRPEIWGPSLMMLYALALTTLGLIWGSVFGAIYRLVYDSIPNKGVKKGLYFGLMVWLVKDIAAGTFLALLSLAHMLAIGLIAIGFFMWIAYGLVIGFLYKK